MSEKTAVKQLLDAIWNENMAAARNALQQGANPSHRVNGYPLLLHAVQTRNASMVKLLVRYGALQVGEALGYALEHGYGEMVMMFLEWGVMPVAAPSHDIFGPYPCRQTAQRLAMGD